MDIEALQATLRTFAAERDWQPFHTPKNLSTALVVEAAELAEIFQWMTPEQSATAHTDAVVREQISDEVADVLLYLIQIADHSQVDLKRAVGRKLVKNAKKHPPLRAGLPAGTAAVSTVETHVLVDWENVQPKEGDLRALVPDATDVWIFHGPNQKVDPESYGSFGSRVTPVKIARSGKNALDFHLSFYMGYIASRHPDARFVVVSNDKGYGPMLEHAKELGFSARQAAFGAYKPKANGGRCSRWRPRRPWPRSRPLLLRRRLRRKPPRLRRQPAPQRPSLQPSRQQRRPPPRLLPKEQLRRRRRRRPPRRRRPRRRPRNQQPPRSLKRPPRRPPSREENPKPGTRRRQPQEDAEQARAPGRPAGHDQVAAGGQGRRSDHPEDLQRHDGRRQDRDRRHGRGAVQPVGVLPAHLPRSCCAKTVTRDRGGRTMSAWLPPSCRWTGCPPPSGTACC
ncbi:MAG: nucleotide pyrophosphohydrolase [Burkholderiales bacterium]|nr:nucleotide pyrophosphohydrolase [Burkholderiales bacterium]